MKSCSTLLAIKETQIRTTNTCYVCSVAVKTNYPRFGTLKQHALITLQFSKLEIQHRSPCTEMNM